jgi:hypothetical protein
LCVGCGEGEESVCKGGVERVSVCSERMVVIWWDFVRSNIEWGALLVCMHD